mmetsp:Transcript_50072/g.160247  ORF Transcript_50072/g.160247 Transcript_50072/m.160247 type:complete len:223 (-) Transcript_50072:165-833(-)
MNMGEMPSLPVLLENGLPNQHRTKDFLTKNYMGSRLSVRPPPPREQTLERPASPRPRPQLQQQIDPPYPHDRMERRRWGDEIHFTGGNSRNPSEIAFLRTCRLTSGSPEPLFQHDQKQCRPAPPLVQAAPRRHRLGLCGEHLLLRHLGRVRQRDGAVHQDLHRRGVSPHEHVLPQLLRRLLHPRRQGRGPPWQRTARAVGEGAGPYPLQGPPLRRGGRAERR